MKNPIGNTWLNGAWRHAVDYLPAGVVGTGSGLGLRLCGLLLAGLLLTPGVCPAQHGSGLTRIDAQGAHIQPELQSLPLSVHPERLPLGTRNPAAGEYSLAALENFRVYVPPKCAGARRCPLVVFLHPSATNSSYVLAAWKPVSDKYGMILLAPNSRDDWQLASEGEDHRNVDAALTQVFQQYAVDPARVALIGYSASGGAAMGLGGYRLDLFSRVILGSSDYAIETVDPHNTTSQFLITGGIAERAPRSLLTQAQALEHAGHPVKMVIGFRDHGSHPEDWDFMGRWLEESWRPPGGTPPAKPVIVADSLPVLTVGMVQQMTAFWTQFRKEPDSIRTGARLAHLREVAVPVGGERLSVLMTDMPTLAAMYPSVAADLKTAGLTPQQHEAYRVALLSARSALNAVYGPVADGPHAGWYIPALQLNMGTILDSLDRLASQGEPPIVVQPSSVQGKNMTFLQTHRELLTQLGATGMWLTP